MCGTHVPVRAMMSMVVRIICLAHINKLRQTNFETGNFPDDGTEIDDQNRHGKFSEKESNETFSQFFSLLFCAEVFVELRFPAPCDPKILSG